MSDMPTSRKASSKHIDPVRFWPKSLRELLDILVSHFSKKRNVEQARKDAEEVVTVLSLYLGGRSTYIPTGRRLKMALRDMRIYDEFDGRNKRELCCRYELSERHIDRIINAVRRQKREASDG